MPTIEQELAAYRKDPKLVAPAYAFNFVLDNRTDVEFDDSFFGIGYDNGNSGGMVTGFKIPPNAVWQKGVNAERCVHTAVASVWQGSHRIVLPSYGPPPAGQCRKQVGWILSYQGGSIMLSFLGESYQDA